VKLHHVTVDPVTTIYKAYPILQGGGGKDIRLMASLVVRPC